MTLLACSYLCVQYLLALGRAEFVPVLALAAVAAVVVLAGIGDDLTRVATALAAMQAASAQPRWSCSACAPARHGAGRTSSCPSDGVRARHWTSRLDHPLPRELAVGGGTAVFVSGSCFSRRGGHPLAGDRGRRGGPARGRPRHAAAGPVPHAASHPRPVRHRRNRHPTPARRRTRDLRSYRSGFWGLAHFGPGRRRRTHRLALRAVLDDGREVTEELATLAEPALRGSPGRRGPGARRRPAGGDLHGHLRPPARPAAAPARVDPGADAHATGCA